MKQTIRISLYTTRQCSNCRKVKELLKKHNIRFMELDVATNQRAFKEFQRLGSRGVPVLLIGKYRVDGFQPNKIEQVLKQNNLI